MMSSAVNEASPRSLVRQATAADLPACAGIINDYMDATPWLPRVIDHDAIVEMFGPSLLEKRTIFVADNGSEILGYLSMDPEIGFIHAIYLRPAARGHGLGKSLLDAAKHAHPQGLELTVFEPNTDAMRFYTREGLIEIPGGGNDNPPEGVPTLLMRWRGAAQ